MARIPEPSWTADVLVPGDADQVFLRQIKPRSALHLLVTRVTKDPLQWYVLAGEVKIDLVAFHKSTGWESLPPAAQRRESLKDWQGGAPVPGNT